MHVLADSVHKFILYATTTAKVHDSQAIGDVLSEEDAGRKLYADSAYCGEPQLRR
ncbi:MAG: transposase [Sutterella seckii]